MLEKIINIFLIPKIINNLRQIKSVGVKFYWTEGAVFCNWVDPDVLAKFIYLALQQIVRSWDHHDILSVLPEYNSSNKCSTSARLRSIAPYSGRKETAVYAADVKTGTVIRCKVFIDNISRIQIFHNSIKLDLDGLATLHVRAFDNEGIHELLLILCIYWDFCPTPLYASSIWLMLIFCCILISISCLYIIFLLLMCFLCHLFCWKLEYEQTFSKQKKATWYRICVRIAVGFILFLLSFEPDRLRQSTIHHLIIDMIVSNLTFVSSLILNLIFFIP